MLRAADPYVIRERTRFFELVSELAVRWGLRGDGFIAFAKSVLLAGAGRHHPHAYSHSKRVRGTSKFDRPASELAYCSSRCVHLEAGPSCRATVQMLRRRPGPSTLGEQSYPHVYSHSKRACGAAKFDRPVSELAYCSPRCAHLEVGPSCRAPYML